MTTQQASSARVSPAQSASEYRSTETRNASSLGVSISGMGATRVPPELRTPRSGGAGSVAEVAEPMVAVAGESVGRARLSLEGKESRSRRGVAR